MKSVQEDANVNDASNDFPSGDESPRYKKTARRPFVSVHAKSINDTVPLRARLHCKTDDLHGQRQYALVVELYTSRVMRLGQPQTKLANRSLTLFTDSVIARM